METIRHVFSVSVKKMHVNSMNTLIQAVFKVICLLLIFVRETYG